MATQNVNVFKRHQGPEYVRWIEDHPSRAVLVLRSTEYGIFHDADCSHIGASSREGRASVAKTRVCGEADAVRKWAGDESVEIDPCKDCQKSRL